MMNNDLLFPQQLIKSFEVCDLPVRAAKFVARKNWVITGSVSIYKLLQLYLGINYITTI